ncbi:MAG: type II secretion system F family protein [Planctomycetota bacterium]|nr:type II secretion system F family protein [Planctomycetota bacterium]
MSDVGVNLRAPATPAVRVGHSASGGRVTVALLASAIAGSALLCTPLYTQLSLSLAVLVGALAWVVDGSVLAGKTVKVESQLADALDLLASSVSAGVSLVEALDGVVQDVRMPLRRVLASATDRLRLGDDPQRVLLEAETTLPLPGFRLLTQYLSVQWQSGGSIAPGLHAISETVRDRVNLARRVQSQAAEARVSVLGILLIVYGIAVLAWVNNPERIESFLSSDVGGGIAAACVLLQAAGIFWMARLTRIDI